MTLSPRWKGCQLQVGNGEHDAQHSQVQTSDFRETQWSESLRELNMVPPFKHLRCQDIYISCVRACSVSLIYYFP